MKFELGVYSSVAKYLPSILEALGLMARLSKIIKQHKPQLKNSI
jgi:hypothetical protein